jgi:hypothetical protein
VLLKWSLLNEALLEGQLIDFVNDFSVPVVDQELESLFLLKLVI